MRRPPYSNRVMKGIYLIWRKMRVNIENGYLLSRWTPQDRRDVNRALQWLGDFFDWTEWKAEVKAEAARLKETNPPALEE